MDTKQHANKIQLLKFHGVQCLQPGKAFRVSHQLNQKDFLLGEKDLKQTTERLKRREVFWETEGKEGIY